MEMDIRLFSEESAISIGAKLVSANDAEFVQISRSFADGLANAQGSRQIPGGLVVSFDGTVGHPARHFFGVMKAELHEGFLKTQDMQATFVNDLFLSPKTKLYKIGLFERDGLAPPAALPNGWKATVYDSAMTAAQRENAALYFHGQFLGLKIPENSAQRVRVFFEKTKEFIKSAPVTEEQRVDLYNSLYTYLKVNQSPTIQVSEFADSYMAQDIGEGYREKMQQENFPDAAVHKDLSEVIGSLRLRKFKFASKITLSGPPDAITRLVTVQNVINPDGGANWTQIIIKGPIESQE